MLRSLLLSALALLLTVPALAQNTTTFLISGFFEDVDVVGLTALIYSSDPEAEPIERVIGNSRRVVLQNLPVGRYYVYLAPNDQAFSVYGGTADVSSETGDFVGSTVVRAIDPSQGFVRGRVVLAGSGDPVRHSNFTLPDNWGIQPPFDIAAIDGDGRFAFQLAPGSYQGTLGFTYNEPTGGTYRNPEVAFSLSAGQVLPLNLTTEILTPGTLTGRVTDAETGAPLDGAPVVAFATNGNGFGFATTDANGDYVLEAPENPEYLVYADYGGDYVRQYFDGAFFSADATLVTIPPGGTLGDINFALSQPADDFSLTVSGTVVSTDGTPLTGEVELIDRDSNDDAVFSLTDGAFEYVTTESSRAGGRFQIVFRVPGYQTEYFDDSPTLVGAQVFAVGPQAVAFDLGQVVLLADGEQETDGLAISGTVASEDGGAALAGAVVAAQRLDAPGVRYAVSDASGAYRIAGLAAGDYAVLFTEADHVPEFYPDAALWTDAERITLSADRGGVNGLIGGLNRPVGANRGAPFVAIGTLSGSVRGSDGVPLAGAVVTVSGVDGIEAYAIVDGSGQFSMDTFSSQMTVTADRGRYQAESLSMSASGDTQVFMTLDAASIVSGETTPTAPSALRVYPNPTRGRLTVDLGTPGADRVAVYDVLGREVLVAAPSATAETVTLDAGRLAPGRYVVRVLSGDRAETRPLTVVR